MKCVNFKHSLLDCENISNIYCFQNIPYLSEFSINTYFNSKQPITEHRQEVGVL